MQPSQCPSAFVIHPIVRLFRKLVRLSSGSQPLSDITASIVHLQEQAPLVTLTRRHSPMPDIGDEQLHITGLSL
jgi:hypothetical protein